MRIKRAVSATLGIATAVLLAFTGTSSAQEAKYDPYKAPGRAAVEKPGKVRPMISDGHSFLEVNTAGQLVYWTRSADGTTFDRQVRGRGWHTARLITGLTDGRFVEIKTDGRLAEWNWINGQYHQSIVGQGWQGSRAITGLDDEHFLEIKPDYSLALWAWTDQGYQQTIVASGFEDTRHIIGLASGYFLEVKNNGTLTEWYWDVNGVLNQNVVPDSDFSFMRLAAGTDFDHWVFVDHDGYLGEFVWDEARGAYVPFVRGVGWEPARLLG